MTFEPDGCEISKLLKGFNRYHSSYNIEEIIDRIAYSLIAYGTAYLYINPEYKIIEEEDGTETKNIISFEIGEIEGIIKRKNKEGYLFSRRCLNSEIKDIIIPKNQLVIFNIKELGYSPKHFRKILKKLSKCDITAKNKDLIINQPNSYDFSYHYKKAKMTELKSLRGIGWSFGTERLSDSYIMYKKIQEDELKIRFLDYIVNKINKGLNDFLGDDAGRLVAHINRKDYKLLWKNYSDGKITGTELTNVLFKW